MKLTPPDLWPPVGLLPKEAEAIKELNADVWSMRYRVEGFAAALELYRFSRSKPENVARDLAWQWQWIGIREGAMQVWFLRESIDVIPRNFRMCPNVAQRVDKKEIERSGDLFDQYFPDFKLARNVIAHAPTFEATRDRHAPPDGLYAGSQLKDGDKFELVNRGKRYQFEMTDDTTRKLVDVLMCFWAAFAPVVMAFDQAGRLD